LEEVAGKAAQRIQVGECGLVEPQRFQERQHIV
jgi:hypothetical protein